MATLPGPSAPGEGAANLDSVVTDAGHRYSDVPSQSLPAAAGQFQQGAAMYGPSSYGQSSNNAAQPLWDQGPAISRMPARQQTPRGAMSSPGMSSMVKHYCFFYISVNVAQDNVLFDSVYRFISQQVQEQVLNCAAATLQWESRVYCY